MPTVPLKLLRPGHEATPPINARTTHREADIESLAAMIAALSGALYPMLRGFVSPELLFFATSGNSVITVVIGGTGTLVGALYGSALLTLLKSVIGSYTEHHLIVIGLLFMAAVVFLPKGLMGIVRPPIAAWLSRERKP